MSLGLLAFALLGADGPTPASPYDSTPTGPSIMYEVRFVTVRGLGWRTAMRGKLKDVAQHEGSTVWTVDDEGMKAFLERLQADGATNVVQAPRVTAIEGASATIRREDDRHYVANLKRIADGPPLQATRVAFQPEVKSVKDGVTAHLVGRAMDQGVLAQVCLDANELQALHTVVVEDGVKGCPPATCPSRLNAQYQVPEVVHARVEGEWLIPKDGALLISLGVHADPSAPAPALLGRIAGHAGPAVREQLVMISARSADEAVAEAAPDLSKAAYHPVPATIPTGPLSTIAPPPMLGGAAPAPKPAMDPVPPAPALPAPAPPSRTLPKGYTPDGREAELPPLPPADEPAPAPSAEPQASPQGRPQASPQAAATAPEACEHLAQLIDRARMAERIGQFAQAEACAREALSIQPGDLAATVFAWKMHAQALAPPRPKDDRPVIRTAIMTTPDRSPTCCDCCTEGKPCEPRKTVEVGDKRTFDMVFVNSEEGTPKVAGTRGPASSIKSRVDATDRLPGSNVTEVGPERTPGDAPKSVESPACCDDAKGTDKAAAAVVPGLPEHPLPKLAKACETSCEDDRQACPLTVKEAIRVGLENSEVVRVVTPGATGLDGKLPSGSPDDAARKQAEGEPIVIDSLHADATAWAVKNAVQEQVRSIEQQYWALSSQYAHRRACEVAVGIAEEACRLMRERREAGKATADSVAEAKERLERARLGLVTARSNLATTERQLRNILGLKPADGRRIVPVSTPAESHTPLNWEVCLAEMAEKQPDMIKSKEALARCEMNAWMSHKYITDISKLISHKTGFGSLDTANPPRPMSMEQAEAARDRQRELYQQTRHQLTHALARFFLEVDANHKQFATARRLHAAATEALQGKWARFEEDQCGVAELFDALESWARDAALEAQYRTSYNISLVAVQEAKGTLLEHEGIKEVGPAEARAKRAYIQARDGQQGRFDPIPLRVISAPKADTQAVPASAELPTEDGRHVYSLRLPMGNSAVQLRVKVWSSKTPLPAR